MNALEEFRRGELLGAAKLNGVVDALNNLVGVRASLPDVRGPFHQAAELRLPVEPAGGIYDMRRGLASFGLCLSPAEVATSAAWVGHGPGVQGLTERRSSCEADGVAWALHPEEGAEVWQVVTTSPAGEVCVNCTRYVASGCEPPCAFPWSVRANEGGQLVRLLGRVVKSPLATCGCMVPEAMKYEVVREHDFQLPVLTQGARIAPGRCHDGYMSLVDPSREHTTVVYNLGLHSPEGDFTLTYDANTVTVWQNQVTAPASGGHVYEGPGAVNGTGVAYGTAVWRGHLPSVTSGEHWAPGSDNACFLEGTAGGLTDSAVWQKVQTDRHGRVTCVETVVTSAGAIPPCDEQLWNAVECTAGLLWHRVGHLRGGRAITDGDWRLPILTQNAEVGRDEWRSRARCLVQADDGSPNRYIKRLMSCAVGLRICDRGCMLVIVDCC